MADTPNLPVFVDLTHILDNDVQTYPGDGPFSLFQAATIDADKCNIHAMSFGSVHTGTHIDAPFHFIAGGKTIEQIPLSDLIGPALIIDLSQQNLQPRQQITWADLAPWADLMKEGIIVVINTGWSQRHWRTPQYFHHPYFAADAAEGLVAKGVRVVGLDTLNPDETPIDGTGGENGFIFHEIFLGAGGVIAENLTNLSSLVGSVDDDTKPCQWIINLIPLNLRGSDGSPIRAFAYLQALKPRS
ncbi:putative cyclase [Crassisporium funariophilum]|nr:putative cyclase [Crassisporium funariophilum]